MDLGYTLRFIIWLFLGGLLISRLTKRQHIRVLGEKRERWSTTAAILLVIPLIYWAGTRDFWFADTGAYYTTFRDSPTSIADALPYIDSFTKDRGYYAFASLFKCFISNNVTVYFTVVAAIQMLCLTFAYRKYSRNYWLSIFLFIASTDYVSWMFNGLRQFFAAALIFAALGLIVRKKYVSTILIILLASSFHQSALLMIPVVFIVQGKAWNAKTNLVLVFAMVCILFIGEFTTFLDDAMQETQYKNVVSDWTTGQDDGTNALRVLVYAIPTIMAFLWRRNVQEADNPLINVCVNMSIVSTGIYIVSMFTSGIFIGRLPIYMSLYNYILLPWEIRHFFKKDTRMFVTVALVGCYCGFYLLQMMSWL